MNENRVLFPAPPRMLLGVAFLFWGAMHEQALVGLIAAIIFEARHWTSLRWKFDEIGFARAWQLCILILVVSAFSVLQIEDRGPDDYLSLLSWLPFILMPLGLAQQYAADEGVPVTTFSFIARRRMRADREQGLEVKLSYFQLGYPFLVLVLISAGMGVDTKVSYTMGAVVILGVALFCLPATRRRPVAWAVSYLSVLGLAAVMNLAIVKLYELVKFDPNEYQRQNTDSFETHTAIGQVKKLQLSDEIRWRYRHERGAKPQRLRLAAYNQASGEGWKALPRNRAFTEKIDQARKAGLGYELLYHDEDQAYSYEEEGLLREEFPVEGTITGLVTQDSLLPAPMHVQRLDGVIAENAAANIYGATQVNDPTHGALRIGLRADPSRPVFDQDPSTLDLAIERRERAGLEQFLKKLDLDGRALPGQPSIVSEADFKRYVTRIRGEFAVNFEYSLFLRSTGREPPISTFLNKLRLGHCEYFASATTLLLRKLGVPSRYVVGYAVSEKGDENEYILRGKHAHAWSQAYIGGTWGLEKVEGEPPVWRCRGGRWVEVDLTPADWLSFGGKKAGLTQWVKDWFEGVRTKLILWFAQPKIEGVILPVTVGMTVVLLLYLVIRLYRTRRRVSREEEMAWDEKVKERHPMRSFEKWLSRRVGVREAHLPLAGWLAQSLPRESHGLIKAYQEAAFDPENGDERAAELKRWTEEAKRLVRKEKTSDG